MGAGLGVAVPPWAVWEARKVGVTVTQTRTLVFVLVLQLFWEAEKLQGDFSELPRWMQGGGQQGW